MANIIVSKSLQAKAYMAIAKQKGKGWLKDLPDFRDNTPSTDSLSPKQIAMGVREPTGDLLGRIKSKKVSKSSKDLREWCSPIEDQGRIGSCTAQAGVGLYEYFEKRAFGRYVHGSRLFLYKVTRNLLGFKGDDGAYLRSTMGALALFGVVPEKYWQYDESKYNVEPSAFLYSYAQSYQALLYYRIDESGIDKDVLLSKIKDQLNGGLPMIFGFTCYSSLDDADDGKIPFPDRREDVTGGHAVMAVGFDDEIDIKNPRNGSKTKGAILIRNSWGTEWGDAGYGYLPYEYVRRGLAEDWWSMTKAEWVETEQFGF